MVQEGQTQQWTRTYIAKGVIGCLGGLALHCVVGSLYQWGMINLYVTSYFKISEPELTLESNAIAFPLMMFCYGLTMRIGIYLTEIIHPIIVLSCITILFSASVFVSSFMSTMWSFLAFYDILFGLFIGMVFMIPVVECNKYFPGKKLYVNGVVFSGTGFGSAVFGSFSYHFLNPHRLKPIDGYYLESPELVQLVMQVPKLIKYLSLFYLCLGFAAIIMMAPVILHNRRVHNEKKEKQRIARQQQLQLGLPVYEQEEHIRPHEANSLWEVVSSWVCWRQCIIIVLLTTGLYLIEGNFKTYVRKTLNDDDFLTLIGVAGSIVNGGSRILWSFIFSKTGYKSVALGITGISVIVLSVIRFTAQSKGGYMFMFILVNLGVGGIQVSNPSLVQYMFGQRMGENCYGFFWCSVAVANFLQFVFVSQLGLILDFNYLIYICLGMSISVIPIILLSTFQGSWKNSTDYLEYCITCKQSDEVTVEIYPSQSLKKISPTKQIDVTLESPPKNNKKQQPIQVQKDDFSMKLNQLSTCDQLQQNKRMNPENNNELSVQNELMDEGNSPQHVQSCKSSNE